VREINAGEVPGETETGVICTQGDIRCFQFDDFDRTFTMPVVTKGAVAQSGTVKRLRQSMEPDGTVNEPTYGDYGAIGNYVAGYLGENSSGWTTRPAWSTCGGFDFTFAGWVEETCVYEIVMGTKPANLVGLIIPSYSSYWSGVALVNGGTILVNTTQPTSPFDGTVIASLPSSSTVVDYMVPASLLPDEGEKLYLMYAYGWTFDHEPYAHTCGFQWPRSTGDGNSGRFRAYLDSGDAFWGTFVSGDVDLGVTTDMESPQDGGPMWDGGHRLNLVSTGGAPVDYGMASGALWLTADSPASITLSYEVETEDEGELESPWDAEGWAYAWEFEIDEVGDTAAVGDRYLLFEELSGHDVKAYVYLGDMNHEPGIGLDGGAGALTTYDFTFAVGVRYGIRVDTRSGEARMRVWNVETGEVAVWPLTSELGEPTSSSDSFQFSIFAGNGAAAADQTVTLYGWIACGYAEECLWVDEWLGVGDGVTRTFYTSQRYARSSLQVRVDGLWVGVEEVTPYSGVFRTDAAPADGAFMWARYLVGSEYDDGDVEDEEVE